MDEQKEREGDPLTQADLDAWVLDILSDFRERFLARHEVLLGLEAYHRDHQPDALTNPDDGDRDEDPAHPAPAALDLDTTGGPVAWRTVA